MRAEAGRGLLVYKGAAVSRRRQPEGAGISWEGPGVFWRANCRLVGLGEPKGVAVVEGAAASGVERREELGAASA